jgi:hypothetical protein
MCSLRSTAGSPMISARAALTNAARKGQSRTRPQSTPSSAHGPGGDAGGRGWPWWRRLRPGFGGLSEVLFSWSRRSCGAISVPSTPRYFQMKKGPDMPGPRFSCPDHRRLQWWPSSGSRRKPVKDGPERSIRGQVAMKAHSVEHRDGHRQHGGNAEARQHRPDRRRG